MTPETRKTTHFFWIYLNNYEGDDTNISRSLHASLIEGFMEDKHIIEAPAEGDRRGPGLQAARRSWPTRRSRISAASLDQLIAKEQAAQIAAPAAEVAATL